MPKRIRPYRMFALLVGLIVLLIALQPVGVAVARVSSNYSFSWHVMGGGGGRSAASHYALDGTLGQPFVTYASSTHRGMQSGFWQELVSEPIDLFRSWLPLIRR